MHIRSIFSLILPLLFLLSCNIDKGNINSNVVHLVNFATNSNQYILINTIAEDYSSSAISLIDTENFAHQKNNLLPEASDFFTQCRGSELYQIGRFQKDRITKYSLNAGLNWQVRTLDHYDQGRRESLKTSNPQKLVFMDNSAILLRFDSNWLWQIDLNTGAKLNDYGLEQYADDDGLSEMTNATLFENEFYVIVNRISRKGQSWHFDNQAYLSRMSLPAMQEHDYALSDSNKGIPLKLKNFRSEPTVYNQKLYLAASGNLLGSTKGAGLEVVDIESGVSQTYLSGTRISKVLVMQDRLFALVYINWNDFKLYELVFDTNSNDYKLVQTISLGSVQDFITTSTSMYLLSENQLLQYQLQVDSGEFQLIRHSKINTQMKPQTIQLCQY